MASLSDIEIKQEVRPCIVDKKKALFHKWIHTKNLLGQEFELGLIEYENGQVAEVTPNKIVFCDYKIKEYCFSSNASNSKLWKENK